MKKILQVNSGHEAYDNIRIFEPIKKIKEQLKEDNIVIESLPIANMNLQVAIKYDISLWHGCMCLNVYPVLKQINFALYVDDLMTDLNPGNPAHPSNAEIEGLKWCYKNADSLIVTTEYLKQKLSEYNNRTFVCPNLVDIIPKFNTSKNVLYSYGNSHSHDLKLLVDMELNKDRNYYFFGKLPPSGLCVYTRSITDDIIVKTNRPNVYWANIQWNYEKYKIWMNNFDYGVGLVPLQENEFNKCKSILKFIEYTQHGSVSVVSSIGAYAEIPDNCVVKVENNNWCEAIEYAFKNREEIYQNALKFVNEKYTYSNDAWIRMYKGI